MDGTPLALASGDEPAARAKEGELLSLENQARDNETERNDAEAEEEMSEEREVVKVEVEAETEEDDDDVQRLLDSAAARVAEVERAQEAGVKREAALWAQNRTLEARNQALTARVAQLARAMVLMAAATAVLGGE